MNAPPTPKALQQMPAGELAKWLTRNCVDCLPEGALATKLEKAAASGKPLRVKLGIDPTAPDIHLGHTVVLGKLREFQDAGHTVVLIIGDYTARIGDPSGRSKTRPELSAAEIDDNAATFQEQAFKILDQGRVEVRRNSEWLDMSMVDLFRILRLPTVAQLLERDDFDKRYKSHTPIALLELLYPVMQAYDSVAVQSDIELGGTDQKFNLLLGRDLQTAFDQAPQAVLTMPILPGVDGVRRMGKSLGNHVGVTEPPEEIFGKTMSIPDDVMATWYSLLLGSEPDAAAKPVAQKRALARLLVERFYDADAGIAAEAHFDRLFKAKAEPEAIDSFSITSLVENGEAHLPAIAAAVFDMSRSEIRRMIDQGGVSVNGAVAKPDRLDLPLSELDGAVLRVGKRRFARLTT
ncbi:MAG: tyrosine--tRNA ligase [Thermoleophilaceae bacterium]|nr:tyrosine--tRNA ligase [Thermoleophilaceae bacterium]